MCRRPGGGGGRQAPALRSRRTDYYAPPLRTDIPGGRRYFRNDFELDDDFDDLVFTVTRPATTALPNPGLQRTR